jgi:uncharacterized Fe-S cluster-containing protein
MFLSRLMARNVGTGQADYYSSSIEIDPIPDDHTCKQTFFHSKKKKKGGDKIS